MTDTAGLRLSRMLRDTESFLLPLTEVAHDVEITRIDFGFDLPQEDALDGGAAENSDHAAAASADPARRARAGAVVLITDAVHSRTGLEAILDEHAGAAALVLPPGAHAHLGDSEAPGGQQGPVLLERSPHVTWSEALVHLRQLKEGATSTLAWPDVDDLSALAAVIADLTGASITIEDPASRVLAHANLGDELDEIRRETILTGAIPAWRIAELEESGFLDTVRHSTDVVERRAAGSSPARSVIALRSEGELIGTIWAAYPSSVDPEPLREVLRDAARAALPVMLRTLRRSPFEKRIRREALGGILAGPADLGPSATLLALPFAGHYCALAFAEVAPEREPVLRFHLRAAFADAVLAHVEPGLGTGPTAGGGAHLAVLVQMSEPMDAEGIRDHVLTTLRRSLPGGDRLAFGVGTPVDRLDEVHRSWTEAVYVVDAVQTRLNSAGAARADAEAGPASDVRRGARGGHRSDGRRCRRGGRRAARGRRSASRGRRRRRRTRGLAGPRAGPARRQPQRQPARDAARVLRHGRQLRRGLPQAARAHELPAASAGTDRGDHRSVDGRARRQAVARTLGAHPRPREELSLAARGGRQPIIV
jgi:hypothetical protein